MSAAESVLSDLFQRYIEDPAAMPDAWSRISAKAEPRRRARIVADFVSGQTDRYAIAEHRRLFAATPELR